MSALVLGIWALILNVNISVNAVEAQAMVLSLENIISAYQNEPVLDIREQC